MGGSEGGFGQVKQSSWSSMFKFDGIFELLIAPSLEKKEKDGSEIWDIVN